jgi:hypothetical protein
MQRVIRSRINHQEKSVRHFVRSICLLGSAAMIGACGGSAPLGLEQQILLPSAAPTQTDRAVYHVRTTGSTHEFTMKLTFTNPTSERVFIPACRMPAVPVIEKWVAGDWVTAYRPVELRCLGVEVIEAGATYTVTYHVVAAHVPNTFPRFEVPEIPGTYRLVWNAFRLMTPGGDLRDQLPLEQRLSNTFQLTT